MLFFKVFPHFIEQCLRIAWEDNRLKLNIHKYGNITASTIPLLGDEHIRNGQFQQEHPLAFVAFGPDFTLRGTTRISC